MKILGRRRTRLAEVEKKLRKTKRESLKKLSGYRIEEIISSRAIALARSVADRDETIYTFFDQRCLYRGLGNGVVYSQTSEGSEVRHAYYLDLKTNRAVDALDLAPEIRVLTGISCSGYAEASPQSLIYKLRGDYWYYDVIGDFVNLPATLHNQSFDAPELLNLQVILAPSHELMHALRRQDPRVDRYANQHEGKQILSGARRGLDEERMATDMSLNFIRQAKSLGVDILRDYNVPNLMRTINRSLVNYQTR
jgi:hypothetical protein